MFGVYGLFSELLEEEIHEMKAFFDSKDLEILGVIVKINGKILVII